MLTFPPGGRILKAAKVKPPIGVGNKNCSKIPYQDRRQSHLKPRLAGDFVAVKSHRKGERTVDDLIKLVSEKAGISRDQASKAVDTVTSFLKEKLPPDAFDQLGKAVGDLGDMADDAVKTASKTADDAAKSISKTADDAAKTASKTADAAPDVAGDVAKAVSKAASDVADAVGGLLNPAKDAGSGVPGKKS